MSAQSDVNAGAEASVLNRIVEEMTAELPGIKAARSEATLQDDAKWRPPVRDFAGALRARGVGLIAEVKKGSPSKGPFAKDLDHVRTARLFRNAGAAAISVLTSRYFYASNQELTDIADALHDNEQDAGLSCPPLLRKEFHIDPYQVLEARALGADAYLLIAKVLDAARLRDLIAVGDALGMSAFVEVTDESEVEMALTAMESTAHPIVIGINNRDLHTFREDLGTTERLRPLIPPELLVVAASGVRSFRAMQRMAAANVDAVLVGEALTTVDDPSAKVAELFGDAPDDGDDAGE
jgi:indole-3-glycerol phosphate synthase